MTYDEALVAGARLFDDGRYWDAHEAWEERWRVETDERQRTFLQALIQIAAALHKRHVTKDEAAAARLFAKALAKLEAGAFRAAIEEASFAASNVPRLMDLLVCCGAMSERQASRTALLVAAYRARASTRKDPLVRDPWAAALVGEEGEALAKKVDGFLRERELWVAVRTAFLDEEVTRWTRKTPNQVVILGAGLDTRAARLAKAGVRFFEVDQPASQRDKRDRLARIDGYPMDAATYVACDFEKDDFLDRLVAAGFDAAAPALFVWEGVTPYLHEPAIRATLRRIAHGCHPETVLVFDHFTKAFVERQSRNEADAKTHELVDALGEHFVFGTNDPLPMLYEEGFRHVRSVSFDEITLSFTGTYDRERAFRFQRIVTASRTKPQA